LLAFLISPLLAGLLVAVLRNLKVEQAAEREIVDSKVCPKCAERVRKAATVCRFCGYEFVDGARDEATSPGLRADPTARRR
jgi:ribosomal protein L40E